MAKVKPKLNGRSNTIEVMPIMQEKEEKTGKNSGVDSRKNLKRKERHTNQHSIDGFIQKNGPPQSTNNTIVNS